MRLTTINVEKFQHDGLVVDRGWTEFNFGEAGPLAQQAFRDHVGRFVRIHPDDVGELARIGLALEDGRIVDAKPEVKAGPRPEAGDTGATSKTEPTAASGESKVETAKAPADASPKGKDAAAKGKDASK
jgi:hypothetical protein